MSRKFKSQDNLLNIANGFRFTSCYILSVVFCYAEIALLKQGNFQLTVISICHLIKTPEVYVLYNLRTCFLSLRHFSVRCTIIHSITALHKERVG